jgi:hypothetical protein
MGKDRWPMMESNYKCEGGRIRGRRKERWKEDEVGTLPVA